jgi:hypothetical protein
MISNVRAEYNGLMAEASPIADGLLWRHLWFAEPGDIWLTTHTPPPAYIKYVSELTGQDMTEVRVVDSGGRVLSDSLLRTSGIDSQLSEAGLDACSSIMFPALFTPGVVCLARRLGLRDRNGIFDFAAQCGTDQFNRKSVFRALATGIKLPVPAGGVARTPVELRHVLMKALSANWSTVIAKADIGGGGIGNIAITRSDRQVIGGVAESWMMPGAHGIDDLCDAIVQKLAFPIVVEEYIERTVPFYFEFVISPNGQPVYHNGGTVLHEPREDGNGGTRWAGLQWPIDFDKPGVRYAHGLAWRFMRLAATMGMRGFVNIDAIADTRGQVWFNECNGRWGGGLAAVAARNRLRKPDGSRFPAARVCRALPPLDFDSCVRLTSGNFGNRAVVLAAETGRKADWEVLLLGDSENEVIAMEKWLFEQLKMTRGKDRDLNKIEYSKQ